MTVEFDGVLPVLRSENIWCCIALGTTGARRRDEVSEVEGLEVVPGGSVAVDGHSTCGGRSREGPGTGEEISIKTP